MPIITPAYPQQNSTYNVTRSTLWQMKQEFKIFRGITAEIVQQHTKSWNDFFKQRNFFSEFKVYVRVQITGTTEDAMRIW